MMPRPDELPCVTTKILTDHGNMYVTITYHKEKPFEVFVQIGKAGTCEKAWAETIGRCISTGLRYGVPVEVYIEQLQGITCTPVAVGDGFVKSPADGIAQALKLAS